MPAPIAQAHMVNITWNAVRMFRIPNIRRNQWAVTASLAMILGNTIRIQIDD